ncbi:MAG: hypothetical protein Q4B77_04875 [Coriobacteriaceae bacterium]|nr:hypothetical protein [Coriobacteriaceae bacterium]
MAVLAPRRAPSVHVPSAEDAAGHDGERALSDAGGQGAWEDGSALDALRGLMSQSPHASSPKAFLSDLNAAKKGSSSTWAVEWETDASLPAAAKGALDRYVAAGGASLVMSGYVDLAGDVWCALVQGTPDWCDLVITSAREGDRSAVRVVRMWAESEF